MKLAFIGCGNMGGAILCAVLKQGAAIPQDIVVYDRNPKGRGTAMAANVNVAVTLLEAARLSDIIILAVKPKDAVAAIREAGVTLEGKALLSVVAGFDYKAINHALGNVKARVLVTMPNLPALVGCGCTAFTNETTFTKNECEIAEKLFNTTGAVEWVDENKLHAFSAVSGCGPAFTAIFLESLADAAVLDGLNRDTAYKLAAQTVMGTCKLMLETGLHPAIIKDNTCSPEGMTIEGIKALERGAFRGCVIDAVGKSAQKFFRLR
jgi:pyrroline-5-carboxylate reductase